MVKPLDLPGVSHSNERTPLLSTSVRSTVSSRSGGFLGPHNGEAFHSARTRRASLAALAARGGESEFGGERPGLARFREEWALSQAPQHPTLLESTFGGQSTSASGAASRDRSRDPPSGGSGDALDTDDEEDDRPAEAGEILDQVRVLAEEAGYVVPPERKDATRDLREAGILAAWATPQILIGFCRYSIVGANLISLGRLGTRELAAGNLGFLSSNVGGYAIIVGLVSSMDTLANQAGKSASPKLSALYAMKTFVVCMAAMPFIFLFMWNGRTIFNAILPVGDRDPEIVDLAGDYLKIMSLAMPAVAAYECLRRYLQSFGLMNGPALAFAISSPVSIFLNWLLVHGPDKWRMGFLGAPVASVIAYNLLFVLIAAYTAFAAPRGSWCGFSRAIFSDLKVVLIFGLAGVASTCSEWYAFEAIGFGATLFSPATQAATAIYSTSLSIFYQVPLGLGAAGAIRVGNLLGRGLPHKAARSSSAGQVLTLCLVSLSCMFLLVWRHTFFSAFSSDPEVLDIVNSNVLLLVAIIILDGLLGLNAGVLRGAGLPEAAARINLFCYWIFGLPLGAFATWRLRSIAGLYSGLAVALALASIWMTGMIWRNDWDARAGEAVARIAVNDYDAKIPHSPPNERLEDVAEDEEEVLGNNQPRQVA